MTRSVLNVFIPLGHQFAAVQMSAGFLHLELWREAGFQGQTWSWWAVGGGGGSIDDLDRVSTLERKCLHCYYSCYCFLLSLHIPSLFPGLGRGRVWLASWAMSSLLGLGRAGNFNFQPPKIAQCGQHDFPRRNQADINPQKGEWMPCDPQIINVYL